jgi:hypothetical protein
MSGLVQGLRHDHCTMEKLVFRHCKFDQGAVAQFLDYCQLPKEPSSHGALVELGFIGHFRYLSSTGEEEFYSEHIGAMAARLLVPLPSPIPPGSSGMGQCTVGSSLQRLVVDVKDYTTFFNTYAAHASHIYLPQLELGKLSTVRDWTLLQDWLPQVVHLTDLTVHFAVCRDEASGVDVAALLRALEGNRSLHHFRMKPEHIPYCTPNEKQRIESILHRNQQGSAE